jgi:hypothetical protein
VINAHIPVILSGKEFLIMKRIVIFACACMMSACLFAQKKESSDLHLEIGANGNARSVTYDSGIYSVKVNSAGAYFGISNYNLFNISSLFSAGFMESLTMTAGATTEKTANGNDIYSLDRNDKDVAENTPCIDAGLIFGPAIGLKFGKVAKLQAGCGLAWNFFDWTELLTYYTSSSAATSQQYEGNVMFNQFGLAVDVACKFLPEAKFSPVVGIRNTVFFACSELQSVNTKSTENVSYTPGDFAKDSFSVYAAGSFNF